MKKFHGYVVASFGLNVMLIGAIVIHYFLGGEIGSFFKHGEEEGSKKVTLLKEDFTASMDLKGRGVGMGKSWLAGREGLDHGHLGLNRDEHLSLVSVKRPARGHWKFMLDLRQLSSMKVYALLEFKEGVTVRGLRQLERRGVMTVRRPIRSYLGKKVDLFYMKVSHLWFLERSPYVRDIYILKGFTARGHYRLHLVPEETVESIAITFHLPYSKIGRVLLEREVSVYGSDGVVEHVEDHAFLKVHSSMRRGRKMVYVCLLSYYVDVEALLGREIALIGDRMSLGAYREAIRKESVYMDFVSFSEKIVQNDYVREVSAGSEYGLNACRSVGARITKRSE